MRLWTELSLTEQTKLIAHCLARPVQQQGWRRGPSLCSCGPEL